MVNTDDSKFLITGAADNFALIWEVKTGKRLNMLRHETPVRQVAWALGSERFLTIQDAIMGRASICYIWAFDPKDPTKPLSEQPELMQIKHPDDKAKFTHAQWGPGNKTIVLVDTTGCVRLYDPEVRFFFLFCLLI